MKIYPFLFLWALLGAHTLSAQQNNVAAGGIASGNGGSATYSVGQVAYTTLATGSGTVTQGVQQPYEIFVLDTGGHHGITLELMVFPNPTLADVVLRIETGDERKFRYELYDLQGRLLLHHSTTPFETVIPMGRYPRGTYILKVSSEGAVVKSFKIIKNEI